MKSIPGRPIHPLNGEADCRGKEVAELEAECLFKSGPIKPEVIGLILLE